MRKIDLITGFLGAGKTTFIKAYAAHLLKEGECIGILENDFGAVNIDRLLLQELTGENCELEMISGGCDPQTHRRRLRTKLIAMGMSGYDRVLVEPSGIYDVDEFFDVLQEEPLDRWYEIGNVIALVDARLDPELSPEADYLLASQAANAGCLVLSRCAEASEEQKRDAVAHVNRALVQIGCDRTFDESEIIESTGVLPEAQQKKIKTCGYRNAAWKKTDVIGEPVFDVRYFFHVRMSEEALRTAVEELMQDPAAGRIFRVKGFLQAEDQTWLELNAAKREMILKPAADGQEVILVIGEQLQEERIKTYFYPEEAKE